MLDIATDIGMLKSKCGNRRVIASMASYPERIGSAGIAIRSLLDQTFAPDMVILNLAEADFPGRESDLPSEIRDLITDGSIEVRWFANDLKPHKKYFKVMKEYPEDLVLTFDDDQVLQPTAVEELIDSWSKHPNAVSARRVHIITMDETGNIAPYEEWVKEFNIPDRPSMQLIATGCLGVLYPPGIFNETLFCEDTINESCLYADDIWLKFNEVIAGVPTVYAGDDPKQKMIDGSQSSSLFNGNVAGGGNDSCVRSLICCFAPEHDVVSKVFSSPEGTYSLVVDKSIAQFASELQKTIDQQRAKNGDLWQKVLERDEYIALLQKMNQEKAERNTKFKNRISKLKQRNAELKEKNSALRNKLRDSNARNARLKDSTSYKIGRALTKPYRAISGKKTR